MIPLQVLAAVFALATSNSAQQAFVELRSDPVVDDSIVSLGAAFGDMDSDGDLDLFVANGAGAKFNSLYRNLGALGFERVLGSPAVSVARDSSDAVWGDLDGDGDLDLFVTNRFGANNELYLNQGGLQGGIEGTFAAVLAGAEVTDGGKSNHALMHDFDSDGDVDLFVSNDGESNFFYLNLGGAQAGLEGTFARVLPAFSGDTTSPSSCSVGADFDGDGHQDLFVGNTGGVDNFLYFGDGSGALVQDTTNLVTKQGGNSQGCAAGDLDGDGDVDLFVVNFSSNNFLYINDGGAQGGVEGVFKRRFTGPAAVGLDSALDVEAADHDLDGDLDLFVANCCGTSNSVFINDGAANFARLTSGPVVSDSAYSAGIGLADMDRDGAPELFVANVSAGGGASNQLFHNLVAGTFTKQTTGTLVTSALESFDVAFSDIDLDGDADLYVSTRGGEPGGLFVNQGFAQAGSTGDFVRRVVGPAATDDGDSFGGAFADLDGDGDPDLVVANRFGMDNFYYRNAGGAQAGTLGEFVKDLSDPMATSGGDSRDVRLADFDNDGDTDVFFANGGGNDDFLFRNQGGLQAGTLGSFLNDATNAPASSGGTAYGADFGDADGDGDLDLFVGGRSGEDNRLHTNLGGAQAGTLGVFDSQVAGPVVTSGGDTFAGSWGDMDNDGDLDLFVANNGVDFLYRNLGGADGGTEGEFAAVLEGDLVTRVGNTRRGEWSDIDNDGDLDLFVPRVDGDNTLYRARGDGSFVPMQSASASGDGGNSRAAAFADTDGDGDVDLVVANFDQNLFVYENTGVDVPMTFTNLGHALAGVEGEPVLAADSSLLPGAPAHFQLTRGAPSAVSVLVIGVSEINVFFKGGTFVPSPNVFLNRPTNANGFWALDIMWPPGVPSGLSVWMQTWVPDVVGPVGFAASNGLRADVP
ncbi:MAG: hypothetical protein DHS20C15_16490 [Planctomycetota bacterium]|nr:MAG: hypothetical protein DHS20C15_16490 [Planctomycetota bacterium]